MLQWCTLGNSRRRHHLQPLSEAGTEARWGTHQEGARRGVRQQQFRRLCGLRVGRQGHRRQHSKHSPGPHAAVSRAGDRGLRRRASAVIPWSTEFSCMCLGRRFKSLCLALRPPVAPCTMLPLEAAHLRMNKDSVLLHA